MADISELITEIKGLRESSETTFNEIKLRLSKLERKSGIITVNQTRQHGG